MHNTSLILYNEDTRIGTGLVDLGTHGSSNQNDQRVEKKKEATERKCSQGRKGGRKPT